jgi:hypothetical protein
VLPYVVQVVVPLLLLPVSKHVVVLPYVVQVTPAHALLANRTIPTVIKTLRIFTSPLLKPVDDENERPEGEADGHEAAERSLARNWLTRRCLPGH